MTVFESIKCKNIDELAEWLDEYGIQDFSPWSNWFDRNFCKNCEIIDKGDIFEYSWCELNDGKCKFFQDMDEAPWGKQIVRMWLESEDNNGVQN